MHLIMQLVRLAHLLILRSKIDKKQLATINTYALLLLFLPNNIISYNKLKHRFYGTKQLGLTLAVDILIASVNAYIRDVLKIKIIMNKTINNNNKINNIIIIIFLNPQECYCDEKPAGFIALVLMLLYSLVFIIFNFIMISQAIELH